MKGAAATLIMFLVVPAASLSAEAGVVSCQQNIVPTFTLRYDTGRPLIPVSVVENPQGNLDVHAYLPVVQLLMDPSASYVDAYWLICSATMAAEDIENFVEECTERQGIEDIVECVKNGIIRA